VEVISTCYLSQTAEENSYQCWIWKASLSGLLQMQSILMVRYVFSVNEYYMGFPFPKYMENFYLAILFGKSVTGMELVIRARNL